MKCLLPLFRSLVCVLIQNVLELSDSASHRFEAVIVRERATVGRDVRKLIPQREPCAGVVAVLPCVLTIRLEHTLMHDHAMPLHWRHERVDDALFLLPGAVLASHAGAQVLQVFRRVQDGPQVNLEQAVPHVGLDLDALYLIPANDVAEFSGVRIGEATLQTAHVEDVNVRPEGARDTEADFVSTAASGVDVHEHVLRLHEV